MLKYSFLDEAALAEMKKGQRAETTLICLSGSLGQRVNNRCTVTVKSIRGALFNHHTGKATLSAP